MVAILAGLAFTGTTTILASVPRADAATITAAYAVGYRNVSLNGYGASGLGVFTLRMDPGDPGTGDRLALCIEAHTSHSTKPGGYRLVDNQVHSPQLDYLLWRYGWPGTAMSVPLGHDHDTATALGALAWYYADASRRGGGPVWADPATGAAVSPSSPQPWSELPSGSRLGLRAGSHRLAGAERRVHELFVEAEARRGPWSMTEVRHGAGRASVTVSGPGGPIAGADGVRFVVRDHMGRVLVNQVAATDRHGVAGVAVPDLSDGGSIEVSMFAPGVHQEWDGDGDIQRLATATNAHLDRRLEVTALPRHIEVHKRSSDDAFSPNGAQFELRDRDGRLIGAATADGEGRARFAPIDPIRHPAPYAVRESAAPAGLTPIDRDVPVPEPVSFDPAHPTVVTVENDPIAHHLVVRKQLDDDRLGPADRSGFDFEVTRADGRSFGRTETGPDGRTPPLRVTPGRFRICEGSRPPWAQGLIDPGCIDIDIDIGGHGGSHEVVYTNLVPTPRISTRVRAETAADSSPDDPALLPADGGGLIDEVRYAGLVPGTVYTLLGEILVHTDDGPQPTGLTGRTTFLAEQTEGTISVRFEVPSDLAPTNLEVGVVVQRLMVGDGIDSSSPIVEHIDPADLDQTFWIPRLDTEAGLIGSRSPDGPDAAPDGETFDGLALVDVGHVSGLPPGRYRAEVVWHERFGVDDCRPTAAVAEAWFEPDARHRASVLVGPIAAWPGSEGGTFVAFHTVERWSETESVVVAIHADCEAIGQTVTLPVPEPPAASPPVEAVEDRPGETPSDEVTDTERADPPAEPGPDRSPERTDQPDPEPPTIEEIGSRSPSEPPPAQSVGVVPTPRPLPRTGSGTLAPGGLALMLAGAGGLVLVSAVHGRRRWW